MNFNEAHYCKADAKGRVMLPSSLKNRLQPILNEGFVLKRSVSGACLELWPMSRWNEMMLKIKKLNRFVKKNNDFIRIFMAGVKEIEIDNAGRLLISKNLMLIAGITKEIAMSPSIDIIEIWDKGKYEKAIKISDEDFEALAEEVMGGSGENMPDVS